VVRVQNKTPYDKGLLFYQSYAIVDLKVNKNKKNMSPENTPVPESKSEFITVPDWNKQSETVEAPTVEAIADAAVAQEASAESARHEIEVAFDGDIDLMRIQVNHSRALKPEAVPGYTPRIETAPNNPQIDSTVDENARMRKITVIEAQGTAPKKHWFSR
jgi:hypothetical protein